MLACKNALSDADGDFEKAVEALRIKGAMTSAAGRAPPPKVWRRPGTGRLIELNSETDFCRQERRVPAAGRPDPGAALESKAADIDAPRPPRWGDKTVEDGSPSFGQDRREAGIAPGAVFRRQMSRPTCTSGPLICRRRSGSWWSSRAPINDAAHSVALQIAALEGQVPDPRREVPEDVIANERRIAEETEGRGKPEPRWPRSSRAGSPGS